MRDALALPKPEKPTPSPRRPIARRSWLKPGAPPQRCRRPRQQRKGVAAAAKRREWSVLSATVRKEHPVCQSCHRRPSTDGAHVFAKGGKYAHLKLVRKNVLGLCRECHQLLGSASVVRYTVMENFYRRLHGNAAFESLAAMARVSAKRR